MKYLRSPYIALVVILLVASLLRFYAMAWDGGYLFHPDERKIVLVASALGWPSSPGEFFSTESPLNPKFFAYGSFPIYLLRALSLLAPAGPYGVPWREDNFVGLGLLGRALSALFDLGTIVLVSALARRLYGSTVALVTATCIAVTVLHIQLAHFYAVDTLLTLLVVATVYLAARYAESARKLDLVLMAIALGLALATKVTAAPLVIPIVVAVAHARRRSTPEAVGAATTRPARWRDRVTVPVRSWIAEIRSNRRTLFQVFGLALLVFCVTQPYAVLDPIRYFGQVGTEALVARGWLDYPYTRQYAGSLPFIYPIVQSTIWGMGVPLGLFAWVGTALFAWQWWRTREWNYGLVLSWALVYFLTIAAQHTKYLRYLLPLLPFLFMMAVVGFRSLASDLRLRWPASRAAWLGPLGWSLGAVILVASTCYALAFTSIYSREHPWLQISNWIYEHVPAGAAIASEHWDDTLPMPMKLNGVLRAPTDYKIEQLPMYDEDDAAKRQKVAEILASSDYVLLASQRLYATIPRLPARYPMGTRYYHLLFGGGLGFELVAFARNDPMLGHVTIADDNIRYAGLPVPPSLNAHPAGEWVWDWGRADESFTVYDHPMPLVFKKTRSLSVAEIQALLTVSDPSITGAH